MKQQNHEKEWTVLIYANGNNDLKPEVWQSKIDAEAIGSTCHANIVLQISQETNELINIVRPFYSIPQSHAEWVGTRRYFLTEGKSFLMEDLGTINMSDPKQLYNFIKWGIRQYPAKHYLLLLGGHGYQFIGTMTDYSQDVPYIMSIPGICDAIDLACWELGRKLDLLVLDTCYCNFIEVLYEFGKNENHSVSNVLTYIDKGPIAGLSHKRLLQSIQQYSPATDLQQCIKQITNCLHYDLIAIEIDHIKLKHIKQLYNDLACGYLDTKNAEISIHDFLRSLDATSSCYALLKDLWHQTQSLLLCHNRANHQIGKLIHIANSPTNDARRIALYSKLNFTKNNCWTYVLSNKTSYGQSATEDLELTPTMLTPLDVSTYISIMNPTLLKNEKQAIFKKLCQYKRWIYAVTPEPHWTNKG